MATISFTIPDDKIDDLVNALAIHFRYKESDGNKAAFVKSKIAWTIRTIYRRQKQDEYLEDFEGDIDIT